MSLRGQSVHAKLIDTQAADQIRSIHLSEKWDPIAHQMIDAQREKANPEAERKEIRGMLRMVREKYEHGLYEGEEYQY